MWFKQAQIYQVTKQTFGYEPEKLAEQLAAFAFTSCLPSLPMSYGFVSPFEHDEAPLVHAANHCMLFCLQFEEKLLPSTVVRHAVNERVRYLAREHDRKVSQKEKRDLKEEMTQTLLPRAFSKFSKMYAYFDTANNWLVIDSTVGSKTEKLIELLYRCLEGIEIQSIETKNITATLTNWLLDGDYPTSLSIEKACVLRDPQQKNRVIRCQHQELSAEGVLSLVKEGCEVNQLALAWYDRVNFSLTEKFILTGIRFHDAVLALAKEHYSESEQQKIDADFFIMTQTLQQLFEELSSVFAVKAPAAIPVVAEAMS